MKKGFTLVELIITIGLISILGLVIVMNMGNTLSEEQETQYNQFKKTIEEAACTYIELNAAKTDMGANIITTCRNSGCNVPIENILKAGLLKESDLKNPKTQKYINSNEVVKITYPNKVKTCTYTE